MGSNVKLPGPGDHYEQSNEAATRRAIEAAFLALPDAGAAGAPGAPGGSDRLTQPDTTQLLMTNVTDTYLLSRSGTSIAGVNPTTLIETQLDIDGTYEAIDNGGLVGNGVADDRAALNTLANTTLSAGGTVVFRSGTYKIGSALTLPANVRLKFERGAKLKPDAAVTVVIRGGIDAGRHQIFDVSNAGAKFVLHNSGAAAGNNQRPNYASGGIFPEWWGALGDSTTDDTVAMLAAWDAATMDNHVGGGPTTGRAWSVGELSLAPGATYVFKKPLRVLANTGIAISGGGIQNSFLSWGHVPVRHTVTANPAGDQLTLSAASTEADIASGKMYFVVATGPSGWSGAYLRILSQAGAVLTLDGTLASYGLTYGAGVEGYIAYDSCLDFNGVFHLNGAGFTIQGSYGNGAWALAGVHYHRVAAETAAGSSRGQLHQIEASQCYALAGVMFGALRRQSDATWAQYQEDMTLQVGIIANGFYSGLTAEQQTYLSQRGISDGTGVLANCLNHTKVGCASYDNKYDYVINATNTIVYGGTAQTGGEADFYINQSPLASSIDGIRSESSHRFIDSASSYLKLFSTLNVSNCFIRGEDLKRIAGTGTCEWMNIGFGGHIHLKNVWVQAAPFLYGSSTPLAISAVGANTVTVTNATVAVLNEFAGAQVVIGVAAGNGIANPIQVAYVVSNTAGANSVLTVDTTFATDDNFHRVTPVAGVDSVIMRCAPRIRLNQSGSFIFQELRFEGVGAATKLDDLIVAGGLSTYEGDFVELDSNENGVPRGAYTDGVSYRTKRRVIPLDHGAQNDATYSPNFYPFYLSYADEHKITASGTLTITLGGPVNGAGTLMAGVPNRGSRILVHAYQDGTGNRTVTWQSSANYPLVWDGGATPPTSWEANGLRTFEFYADGTNWRGKMIYASGGTGPVALTYGTTVATNAALAEDFTLSVTNGTAFTISNPTNAIIGRRLTLSIKNTSGGAMGAITWGSEFKMAGVFTNPATGTRRVITFYRETSTEWVERSRNPSDVA